MLYVACYFLAVLQCISTNDAGEWFSANVHLESALHTERRMAGLLTRYVEHESAKLTDDDTSTKQHEVLTAKKMHLEKLQKLAESYLKHSERSLEDIEGFVSNPINSFLLIKSLVEWRNDVTHFVPEQTKDPYVKELLEFNKVLPTQADLNGAVYSINRLQDFYFLNYSDVANGDMMGVKSPKLSMDDCLVLGDISFKSEDLYHARMWYSLALERSNTLNDKAYLQNMLKNLDITDTMNTRPEFNINRKLYISYEQFLTYTALCRGEKKDHPKYGKRRALQICRLSHNNNPRLILQPAKEEILSTDPWIVIYHDVVSESEMEELKRVSVEMINVTTANRKLKNYIDKNIRIVRNIWLYGEESPVVDKVNQRIEAITGLSVDSAEALQTANYGIGGHYIPHCDSSNCDLKENNEKNVVGNRDRIATFMMYISDVQKGGGTVFPNAGISVKPEKASAVFWYNLRKNGSQDLQTMHGACPVLLGNKWVAVKWIHERGQEFRRLCGTRPQD